MSERKTFDASPGRDGDIIIFVHSYWGDSITEHIISIERAKEIIAGIEAAIQAAQPPIV